MFKENFDLKFKFIFCFIVINVFMYGFFLVVDLFVDIDDIVLLLIYNWGNYKFVFSICYGVYIDMYFIFDNLGYFIIFEFVKILKEYKKDKVIIILNYFNNLIGYILNKEEVNIIVNVIEELVNKGIKVVIVVDDVYYGLFYEEVY